MKKLIALIGAVATAFGLYAADSFSISFEGAESAKGVDASAMTFTPPSPDWKWDGDTLNIKAYGDGEMLPYGTGALARRDSSFVGEGDNDNYLTLETGTNALTRAVGGNVFLDQLVKFTGFEEYQTNVAAGTKIAVWMSAIETEGTPQIGTPQIGTPAQGVEGEDGYVPASDDYQPASEDYQPASDDYIAGETNLYITVGKADIMGNAEPIALKIDGTFKLDTWYRLTIKSIGNVFGESQEVAPRAGFIVYINGVQAKSLDSEAKTLIATVNEMTSAAKGLMDDGALFPAIDTTDATFATVGYQGIGAIDDIILDDQGPAFAQAIDVEITFPVDAEGNPSVEVDYIDVGGVHMTYPCAVPAGTLITVYFKAVDGKKIMSNLQPQQLTVTAKNFTIDVSKVKVEDVVAKKNGTVDLAESELYTVLGALVENDTVETISTCNVTNGEAVILYSFTPNTTITATAAGWDVFVGNYDMDDGEGGTIPAPGMLTVSDDITANFTMNVGVEDEAQSWVIFSGTAINGQLAITNGLAMTGAAVTVGDGALLKAANFTPDAAITLVGTGKFVTQTDLVSAELGGMIVDGDGNTVVPTVNDPEEGWYTYAIPAEQPFVPSAKVADDLKKAIAYLKNNYYNKYTNGQKIDAPDTSYVKVGTLASEVTGTVSIGGTVADAGEKFSLSIGNNAFLESYKFKIVDREVYVAAVILAIEEVKVTANETDYPIESANSGNLELESFNAVAPTTIAGEGTNFTIVRGDDKPLVKFFFTDKVTQYFVTKKTFIGKDKVATTSYGFTTPDEGGLWLYLGYGVGLGGNWDGATYNYTVYAFGTDKKAITLSMSITDKQPAFKPSATVAADLATAIDHLKANYYNKYTNGDKVAAPDASFVKVGTLASEVTGTVSIGDKVADAGEKFSLSIGNNAFLESYKFKIVGREVYVAAVILAIEKVEVTANEKPYLIDSATSGQLELESFKAVAPTTIEDKGTNFAVVRGDDKPLVKFFFTDKVTQYFVTKKTFIGKDKVATTSYGFTTPDEGGLWLYLGYGNQLGGDWDGVTYNYTVYAFGTYKKAITLSMSITDKAVTPAGPTSDQGAIGEMDPSTGIAEFNPTDASVTEATVNLGDSKAKIAFPKQVKTIKGVPANQIVIKSEGYDITDALAFTGDSSTGITYDLNPDAIVATVPVKPTIAAENADITGGTLEVKGIAGLYYTLVGKDDVTQMATASKIADTQATETGATISLKDQRAEKPTVQFYQIKVTIDRIAE